MHLVSNFDIECVSVNTTTHPLPRLSVSARAWALHPFCVFGGQWPFCSENDIVSTIGAEQSKHMRKHDRGRPEPERVSRTCCWTRRACSPWSCLSLAAPAPPSAGPAPGAARRRQGRGRGTQAELRSRGRRDWRAHAPGVSVTGFSRETCPGGQCPLSPAPSSLLTPSLCHFHPERQTLGAMKAPRAWCQAGEEREPRGGAGAGTRSRAAAPPAPRQP